jgi:hypothetical protein
MAAGVVSATPISTVLPVGAFSNGPAISYSPRRTRAAVELTIVFSTYMELAQAASVFFTLPGFHTSPPADFNYCVAQYCVKWIQNMSMLETWHTSLFPVASMPATVVVPSTYGLRLPANGLKLNQNGLQASCNAAAGPILSTAIPSSNSVGVISGFSLTFSPRLVSAPTSITMSMVLNADLDPQNIVQLILPGFRGPSAPSLNFSSSTTDGNYVPITGQWDLASTTLTVQIQRLAIRNKPFAFTVDTSSQLQLPAPGIQVNQTGFSVSTNATSGYVSLGEFYAQPVAVFTSQNIDLSGGAALMPCSLHLSFSLNCALSVGDEIFLGLPDFRGGIRLVLNLTQAEEGANFSGSWQAPILSLRVRRNVASHSIQWANVSSTQGLTVPESGVSLNQDTITLSVRATCGSVDQSPFSVVQPIGAFRSTSLEFLPHQATLQGAPVGIRFRFAPVNPIANGEIIILFLPGFRGADVASLNISTESGPPWHFTGSFALGSEPTLRLTAAGSLPSMQLSIVHIQVNNGIMLPLKGLTHNQTSLLIGSNAALGPSVGQPILNTPAVGVFSSSTLHFGSESADSRAHAVTSMRLRFAYNKDIRPTETVTLQLPLFLGPPSSLLAVSASTSLAASWNPVTSVLNMTFNAILSAGTLADISIHASNGIVLPITGVASNQSQITLAATAQQGSCSAVPVLFTEPVGAVLVSYLDFVGAAATMSSQIVFSYTMSCGIQVGESMTLSLPDFYGTDESNLNISTLNFNGSWSAASRTITLIANQAVSAQTPTLVRIEATSGIKVPVHGVAANETAFLFAVLARLGPTLGVAFQRVGPIGAFLSTELDIFPRVASVNGIPVGLRLRFTLNRNLTVAPKEIISLALPGFRGLPNGTYSVLVETVGDYIIRVGSRSGQIFRLFSGAWSNVTEKLSLVANDFISGQVDVTISKNSFLALPQSGSLANSTLYLLSTNAALGPSVGQAILKSPSVGSFRSSSMSFSNARAGGLAEMQLNFTLVNSIAQGESVTFTLPDFSGPDISPQTLRQAFQFNFTWTNGAKKLKLTFLHSINPDTLVHVTISASFNIKIPDDGLRANHPILIETDAQSGPIEGIPVLSIPSVGVSSCCPVFPSCILLPCICSSHVFLPLTCSWTW